MEDKRSKTQLIDLFKDVEVQHKKRSNLDKYTNENLNECV